MMTLSTLKKLKLSGAKAIYLLPPLGNNDSRL